jgi:hypothetical protein
MLSTAGIYGPSGRAAWQRLIVMSLGLGAIFVGAAVAANAGVTPDGIGLAAGAQQQI